MCQKWKKIVYIIIIYTHLTHRESRDEKKHGGNPKETIMGGTPQRKNVGKNIYFENIEKNFMALAVWG